MRKCFQFTFPLLYSLIILLPGYSVAGNLTITLEERKQRSVHDTVVELVGSETVEAPAVAGKIEITQVDKEYTPELTLVPRGSSVLFSNKDPFQHHVYSVSKGNQFDLPLYQDIPEKKIVFDTPGIVKLGCNIHDWMLAFSYVSQSQYVAIADASGKVEFTDLPAGEYRLLVWNPRLKNNKKLISESLTIDETQSLDHTVQLSLRNKIRKPKRKEGGAYDYMSGTSNN